MAARGTGNDRLVSVVVPTYDRPDFLREAVSSVRDQTYSNVELIVVDDCSPTPAAETVEAMDTDPLTTVRCIRHEENRGANAARNTGIDAAEGEFVAFLDDDDRWLPEKLERQVAAFDRDERVGLVYTGQRYVDGDGNTTEIQTPETSGDATEAILRGSPVGTFSTVMVRASVVEEAGRLDERFPSWQDREWILRVSKHCRIAPVPEPLVIRRMEAHAQISDDYERKRDVSYPLFLEKHGDLAAEYGPDTEREFVAHHSQTLAFAALDAGHYRDAVRYALRTIRLRPRSLTGYLSLVLALGGDVTYRPAKLAKRTYVKYCG